MAEVKVKGLAELHRFLQQLPAKMEKNVLQGALRAGAKVIADEAKLRVPKKTGRLRDSIRISARSQRGTVTATIRAGGRDSRKRVVKSATGRTKVQYDQAFYATWVEFGTKAHRIKARGKGMYFGGSWYKSVKHPGARPQPFMRPALDGKARDATVAAGRYIADRLKTKHGLDTGVSIA